MSSRFAKSYVCLNGPKEGDYIDAPPGVEVGNATAVRWANAKGLARYAVYVLVELHDGTLGLLFMESHKTPAEAQRHADRFSDIIRLAASQPN